MRSMWRELTLHSFTAMITLTVSNRLRQIRKNSIKTSFLDSASPSRKVTVLSLTTCMTTASDTQQVPSCAQINWLKIILKFQSTGQEVSTTQRSLKPRASATSTTASWEFLSYWKLTKEFSILTLTAIMATELRKHSWQLIESWLFLSISTVTTSLAQEASTISAQKRENTTL